MENEKKIHPSIKFGFSEIKLKCPKCDWIGFGLETIDIGNKTVIDISRLDKGVYLVRVGNAFKKLIVE